MWYIVKTPYLLKKIYPDCIWDLPTNGSTLYLTFDDGPCPVVTPYVLDQLKKYEAKATFFCLGKNVEEHPTIYQRILEEGHVVGNHTYDHVNGWAVNTQDYLQNIADAAKHIDSNLFRPPYGRITQFQSKLISKHGFGTARKKYKIVMWNVVSGDFDTRITAAQCLRNVIRNVRSGAIIVFHDSEKAYPRMKNSLAETLRIFSEKGFRFASICV